MVGGLAKAYGLPIRDVLYGMSYANLLMYGAVIPSYRGRGAGDSEPIDADDPRNQALVREALAG